ncbi:MULTISPECIES: DUF1648 domain-containing protein [unclassified Spirosoma]|uniref:DUF1648 domain-containing protein n=1 Tax=unclassified Spirosoma TaxID=2621999 RepID=UPI0009659979|nr:MULTISPECIES: DUF1648 domain-containing protein [unclassified Spirosoma]MBN8823287.1 DUF1648 domain-containing protein [Spirosoma sp.]OJW72569.1 MAG: hypothetical protein BGO59_15725 [Spirosoma sp. 48-14]
MTTYERTANWLTILLLTLLTVLSIVGAVWLPSPIAIHYNLQGQPDRWGSPATLLILPVIAVFTTSLLWVSQKIHPDFMNFPGPRTSENVARQLGNIRLMTASLRLFVVSLFLLIQGQSIWAKFYNHDQLSGWTIPCMISFVFVLVGFFVWRAYKLVPK